MAGANQGKILLIRGGAIGDFILTLPVLAALRKNFPEARLEVLGYTHIAALARAGELADEVRSIEAGPLAGFFARNGTLDASLQEYFSGFAIILSYLYDPDGVFQANVARCSKAQFIAGPHRPEEKGGLHATQVFLQPLQRLAIFDADPIPRLRPRGAQREPVPFRDATASGATSPPTGKTAGCATTQPTTLPLPSDGRAPGRGFRSLLSSSCHSPLSILAVHPGSGSERKNWPETNWRELLPQLLQATPLHLLLISGEAEQERLPRLVRGLPAERVAMAKNLPLPELARRLTTCVGFLGHDSGITHLAAAVGLPALALWGDSVEAVWRPQGENVKILRATGGLAGISVALVLQEIADLTAL